MNRLAESLSPYLRQHAGNPVDWWEWGEDAFAEARRRDVPILLSVGYAACHWCHVMAHESFEDAEVAAALNENFVAVKVDREERPDVDAVYMNATTALTGHGGWPMTCLLTTEGEPFYCGTYFPRDQFLRLITAVGSAWRADRAEVLAAGQRITAALRELDPAGGTGDAGSTGVTVAITPNDVAAAVATLNTQFDTGSAGFGRAPKFPPSMVLEFLLRHHERTGNAEALRMATATLEAMARGGIYDQLGGGFARYSVDTDWVVPHFEKMLYDNAQLLGRYLHGWRRTGLPLAERVARETADFLLRDLRTDEGGFASALDADTEGVEGLTYAWTPEQFATVLGDDADRAAALFSVTAEGTFEHGASTLQLRSDPDDAEWFDSVRARLLAERDRRPQPARDDKVVTAWNGLAIGALAEAGVLLDEPRYLDAAVTAAHFVVDTHWRDGRLRRASLGGAVSAAAGVAEDYGDLAEGLLMLHQATADEQWLQVAGDLLEVALAHFGDGNGGFFDTADDAETLLQRPRDASDNAAPSGTSALAAALITHAALTGSSERYEVGRAALGAAAALARTQPRFFGHALSAAEALADGPVQVAVVGETAAEPPGGATLTALAWRERPPGAVVVSGAPDQNALLADRPLVGGRPAAYVCRGMVCDLPVTDVDALQKALHTF